VKYAFIDRHRRSYEIKALCDALQVSRSGYYAARGRAPSARQERQAVLTARILEIHTASRETYGAPRVHAELSAQKVRCCRNTVAKLMRRASILPKVIRRFRVTTDSRKTRALPNLIGRVFTTASPNACWLSEITYIPTREGWLYLAAGRALLSGPKHRDTRGKTYRIRTRGGPIASPVSVEAKGRPGHSFRWQSAVERSRRPLAAPSSMGA